MEEELNPGQKDDQGKQAWDRLPIELIEEVVRVLTYGAEKYPDDSPQNPNWKRVPDAINKYYAAALRHIVEHRKGNAIDNESGLYHLAHAISNLIFLLHFEKLKYETGRRKE